MLSFFNGLRGLSFGPVLFRMLMACFCGAAIGLERSSKNRPAGFRTHILVCMGAALAAMTGLYLFLEMKLATDVSRLSTQVISGLGFIVAGTIIITKRMTIRGLTTAAGLWTTGIIGLAIGSGYYELALLGAVLVLLTETWVGKLASHIQTSPEYNVELLYNDKNSLDQVLRYCKDNRMAITNLKITALENNANANYAASVSLRGNVKQNMLIARVAAMPGIVSAVGL